MAKASGSGSGRGGGAGGGGGGAAAAATPVASVMSALDAALAADRSPITTMAEVRSRSGLGREAFDNAIRSLSSQNRVVLHFHDNPQGMRPATKEASVVINGRYYHTIARRRGVD